MVRTQTLINIRNLNRKKKIIPSDIKRVASIAAARVCAGKCSVNIAFVTDSEIRALNRRYLSKDRPTDVLAFPGESDGGSFSGRKEREFFLGDIAISSDTAYRNSRTYGVSFRDEIARYVAHGVLHLGGYRDHKLSERLKMRKMEDEILQAAGKKIWE